MARSAVSRSFQVRKRLLDEADLNTLLACETFLKGRASTSTSSPASFFNRNPSGSCTPGTSCSVCKQTPTNLPLCGHCGVKNVHFSPVKAVISGGAKAGGYVRKQQPLAYLQSFVDDIPLATKNNLSKFCGDVLGQMRKRKAAPECDAEAAPRTPISLAMHLHLLHRPAARTSRLRSRPAQRSQMSMILTTSRPLSAPSLSSGAGRNTTLPWLRCWSSMSPHCRRPGAPGLSSSLFGLLPK